MAKRYIKNASGQYVRPAYLSFMAWFAILVLFAIFVTFIDQFLNSQKLVILVYVSYLLVFLALGIWMASMIRGLIKAKSIQKYLIQRYFEGEITKTLLSTLTVNQLKDGPYIEVPKVKVIKNGSIFKVEIEKLPGMYELERLEEDIDATFRGRYSGYAITEGQIIPNRSIYRFKLEDVARDKTLRPKSIEDFGIQKYMLKLQKGLTINLAERAHIAVWGRTGSRKSTVLMGMLLQLFGMGADVRILDGKDEFLALSEAYDASKIVSGSSNTDQAIELLSDVLRIVESRQVLMSSSVRNRRKMGLKASDVDLRPVVLVADEIGSIMATMDSKEIKAFQSKLMAIIQKGRSVGVSVIISTQDPSVDTLPQKIRNQFATKILLGDSNSDIQRMAFGEVATDGKVDEGRGYYVSDGLTLQPMLFYVIDLYSTGLNDLNAFEEAVALGRLVKYEGGE